MSTSPAPPSNHTELYGRVGIPLFIGILLAGLTGIVNGHTAFGVILVIFGIVGLIVVVHRLGWRHFTWLHAFISAVTALLVSWAFLAYVIWARPTAEELSSEKQRADNAQIKIGQLQTQLETARTAAVAPYVNPLHDEKTKWKVTQGLRLWSLRFTPNDPHSPDCMISVIHYPESYSQDYAADFEKMLDVVGWKYTKRLADGPLPKGISFRQLGEGPSAECASVLYSRIQTDVRTRGGNTVTSDLQRLTQSEASEFLKHCPIEVGCVEVTFGNEDNTQR